MQPTQLRRRLMVPAGQWRWHRRAPPSRGDSHASLLTLLDAVASELGYQAKTVRDSFHSKGVRAVVLTGEGKQIVSGARDGAVRVWERGRILVDLRRRGSSIEDLAITRDGGRLAAAGDDGTIRVWALPGGRSLAAIRAHQGTVTSVNFSRDGDRLVSAGYDHRVRVWQLGHLTEATVLKGHEGAVTDAAFSPNGEVVASAATDGMVRIWEWRTRKGLGYLPDPEGEFPGSVGFDNTGDRLVVAGQSPHVRIWACAICAPLDEVLSRAYRALRN